MANGILDQLLGILQPQQGGILSGYQRVPQDSGAAEAIIGRMPQNAPQAATQANYAPQATSRRELGLGQPAPASGGGIGGAIGGLLGNLLGIDMPDPHEQQAVDWLVRDRGYDPGTARIIASDQNLLRRVAVDQGPSQADILDLQKKQLEVENLRNPTTDDIREYQFAVQQGYQGTLPQFMTDMKKAGATNVNVGPQGIDYGNPPTGYAWQRNPDGTVALDDRGAPVALPVGPALAEQQAAEQKADERAGTRDIQGDVVTTAADNARKLISGATTGTPGRLISQVLSESDAAALRREVNVLKSATSLETLNAMRQQSPTGGALGNVTERELDLLAAAAGAIDPNAGAQEFSRALDNYEHTLLRIIHGSETGDRVFRERANANQAERERSYIEDQHRRAIDPNRDPLGIR